MQLRFGAARCESENRNELHQPLWRPCLRMSGGPGRLLSPASHRSGHAGLLRPVPRIKDRRGLVDRMDDANRGRRMLLDAGRWVTPRFSAQPELPLLAGVAADAGQGMPRTTENPRLAQLAG